MKTEPTLTLRQLIAKVCAESPVELYASLCARDQQSMRNVTLESTTAAYSKVIRELSVMPKARAHRYPVIVQVYREGRESYPDASLWNRAAVSPPKGMRPWGGKKAPKGYYNCNLNKYNRYFALGFTPWKKMIDTPVFNRAKLNEHELLAAILWEMTFYGWSAKQCPKAVDDLGERFKAVREEIKSGQCTVLPRGSRKGFDIVIPDSVRDGLATLGSK